MTDNLSKDISITLILKRANSLGVYILTIVCRISVIGVF